MGRPPSAASSTAAGHSGTEAPRTEAETCRVGSEAQDDCDSDGKSEVRRIPDKAMEPLALLALLVLLVLPLLLQLLLLLLLLVLPLLSRSACRRRWARRTTARVTKVVMAERPARKPDMDFTGILPLAPCGSADTWSLAPCGSAGTWSSARSVGGGRASLAACSPLASSNRNSWPHTMGEVHQATLDRTCLIPGANATT